MRTAAFCGSLFTAANVFATVWHVSPAQLLTVSARQQFRTIHDAASHASAGDVVLIHCGVYRETVVVQRNGKRARPINFEAAHGANVVVTGLDRLTKWRKEESNVYSAAWPYRFIGWSKFNAHPDDEFHRLIGRAEQVVMNGALLHQTLDRNQLTPGTFYVDLLNKRLYVSPPSGEDLNAGNVKVEAATRSNLWESKGDYISVRGIHFRYAANAAQQGAVVLKGRGDRVQDCSFEDMNGPGASFVRPDQVVRRCTFSGNGQLGFGAFRAHNLRLTDCTIQNNNTKGFNHQWEAGGNKIVLSRGVIIEHSRFLRNRGNGIWFDTGNEDATVRNCLIADNEDAGIFYEISYGLNAHDNVVVGNGFASTPGAWGEQAGIVVSSSPNCIVERNLIVGNREGFNFREQTRSSQRIDPASSKLRAGDSDSTHEEPIWNHDERVTNNVIAYNRDAQTRGWFDVADDRQWPAKTQTLTTTPAMSLETLKLGFSQNVYACEQSQRLFVWGVDWRRNETYSSIPQIHSELDLEQGSEMLPLKFKSIAARDFRLPAQSPVFRMNCYPRGKVPNVKLGKLE